MAVADFKNESAHLTELNGNGTGRSQGAGKII